MTAAHRSLPFGTLVRVTHLGNGRSVVVRINDRGPFVRGRIIDVKTAAGRALGFSGLARVTLVVLDGGGLTAFEAAGAANLVGALKPVLLQSPIAKIARE
jgi:rare lipoprotein A